MLPVVEKNASKSAVKPLGKRFLLLTDIPPCSNFTAGLVLRQLCQFLPEDSLVCFNVLNKDLDPKLDPALNWMPLSTVHKPNEAKLRRLPGRLGAFEAYLAEIYTETVSVARIARKAAEFARAHNVDAIWCVVQGQTMIRLANQVKELLNVPLLTEVWDPPAWWLRANKVDGWSQSRILKDFDRAMSSSTRMAAASWAMAEEYNRRYKCNAAPLIPSLDVSLARSPAQSLTESGTLTIGMAGQLYSSAEWETLLLALNSIDWKIGNRKVQIKVLGRSLTISTGARVNVEFLGWRAQEETIELLSNMDVLYCAYWFDHAFKEEASLSFPSKLTTYLAAGRPVFFHGPTYASPAKFLTENDAGVQCNSLDAARVIEVLQKLVSDQRVYEKAAANGTIAFHKHLTLTTMRRQFAQFLGVDESVLVGF